MPLQSPPHRSVPVRLISFSSSELSVSHDSHSDGEGKYIKTLVLCMTVQGYKLLLFSKSLFQLIYRQIPNVCIGKNILFYKWNEDFIKLILIHKREV